MTSTKINSSLKGKNLNRSFEGFKIFEGSGHPFGATVKENGVNFYEYGDF